MAVKKYGNTAVWQYSSMGVQPAVWQFSITHVHGWVEVNVSGGGAGARFPKRELWNFCFLKFWATFFKTEKGMTLSLN